MMDKQITSILSTILIPKIILLLVEKESYTEIDAINSFYNSKTYELLCDQETEMWHYSPLMIVTIWKNEQETGEVVFPG